MNDDLIRRSDLYKAYMSKGKDKIRLATVINELELTPAVGAVTGRWIPVTERMPDAFRPVIVCREKGKGEYVVEQGFKDVGDWWKVYGTRTKNVTHWMPLPEPPEVEAALQKGDDA